MAQRFYVDLDLNQNQLLNATFYKSDTPPENPVTGQIYYSTANSENQLKIYDGTSWQYIDSGLAVATQSDWAEDDSTSPAFIKNKPDLSATADIGNHSHNLDDITGLDDALADKADAIHNHTINSITNLQANLDSKANVSHNHDIADIADLSNQLADKVNKTLTINIVS